MNKKFSKAKLLFAGILSITMGTLILYQSTVGQKLPTREILAKHSGSIQWIREDKRGIEFVLSGSNRIFYYSSIDSNIGWVYKGLESAQNPKVVTVLYNTKGWAPPFTSRYIYHIYEISVPNYGERTYSQFKNSHDDNDKLGVIGGYIFIGGGIFLIATHRLMN